MPSDATEAALGLLGLTGAFPSSSTTTPTIPAKRKQAPPRPRPPPSPDGPDAQSSDSISCICGFTYDDGFSIGCDSCSRWSHAACFNIVENQVPDEWHCWICAPRPVDKDRAVKLQKARQRQAVSTAQSNGNATSNGRRRSSPGVERKTRRPSALASAQDPSSHPNDKPAHSNKRKRRASTSIHIANSTNNSHPQEDEHVDIDEPWTHSYVPITKDIVPSDGTRDRLRRVASDWRGVSAISGNGEPHTPGCTTPALLAPDDLPYASPASLCPPQISIAPLHGPAAGSVWPGLYANGSGSHSVRPPSYAVHANKPIQSSKLIAPYPSTIIPTSMYLRDPLNAYAHLGLPKPFVHLFGPPLDVALDARITGDQSRFVRSGCRPNAILRPMLCAGSHAKKAGKDGGEGEDEGVKFGIFALRDLKPNEEIVLGWEWDDDNVVHRLPALIQSPFTFPPHQLQHFRNQMTSMLHSLSSTFTTCACGAKARDCVLGRIAEFVENQTPLTPSPSPPSLFAKEKEKEKEKHKARKGSYPAETETEADTSPAPVDLGPLVGVERGFRTRERIPASGGMGGVEMVVPPEPEHEHKPEHEHEHSEAGPSRLTSDTTARRVSFPDELLVVPPGKAMAKAKVKKGKKANAKGRKGKGREEDGEESAGEGEGGHGQGRRPSDPEGMDVDEEEEEEEECLPPRLRKAWIAKSLERLREQRGGETTMSPASSSGGGGGDGECTITMDGVRDECYFDSRDMPPPPVPPSRTPPMTLSTLLQPPPISISATSTSSTSTSTCSSNSKPRVTVTDGAASSPSVPFSKLSLLSPVVPLPLMNTHAHTHTPASASARPRSPSAPPTPSTSTATSKAESKKRKRPAQSPQPPPSEPAPAPAPAKPAKAAKARTAKGKEKAKEREREEESEEERDREVAVAAKPKAKSKPRSKAAKEKEAKEREKEKEKLARPSTPATESDEPSVLKASIVRRGDKKTKTAASRAKETARSTSVDARSTASASATASPCVPPKSLAPFSSPGPPPTTPVVVLPELPPEPPDTTRRSVPLKVSDLVEEKVGPAPDAPDAMDVDRPPVPASTLTPKASPAVSARALPSSTSTPPAGVSRALPSTSPAASPVVPSASLPPSQLPPSPTFPPAPPPPPPPEPIAIQPASLPQDAMAVDRPADPAPGPPSTVQPVADDAPLAPLLPESGRPPPEREAVCADRHSSPAAPEPECEAGSGDRDRDREPPPPAKVKLSVKDFLRKKKQREEERKEREKGEQGQGEDRTESPRIPTPTTSPLLEPDTPAIATATGQRPLDLVGLGIVNGDVDVDVDVDVEMAEEGKDADAQVTVTEPEGRPLAEPVNGIHGARAPDAVALDKVCPVEELPPPPPLPPMSPVVKDATSDLVAPVPNGHGTYPSSRRSPTPDRFFYGRRKTESTWDDRRYRSPSPRRRSPSSERRRRTPSEDFEDRRDCRRADSIQTKVEMLDSLVPNGLVAPADPCPIPRSPSLATPPRSNSPTKMSYSPPRNAFPTPQAQSQPQSSQEDGEIFSPPPPKPPPLAPRSHTPPTHPRSFYAAARGDISPTRRSPPPPSSARRPLHPTQYSRNPGPGPPRLAPSAPRALREGIGYVPSPLYGGGGGGQNAPYFAPRGPSADRDRDRDRERGWARDRGDGERTWVPGPSRGRGRGTWGR